MKVCVVGCGNISKLHIKAIEENPDLELAGVCDIKKERALLAAIQTGAEAYTDYYEMIKAVRPACVHICTPHYLHTPFALFALENGVNVLIEKPCSTSLKEIDELCAAQKKSGLAVGVCFQNRYNACVLKAKSMIESGEYGKIKALRGFVTWSRGEDYYSDDWHGTLEKECGGVLINQAIHTIDLLQMLGGGCQRVISHTFNDHLKGKIEVEDTATILMQMKNGAPAILYATTAYGEDSPVLIEICLENAVIRLEGDRLYVKQNDIFEYVPTEQSAQCLGKKYWGTGHFSLINDFYYSLLNNKQFEIDAIEGAKACEIVSKCYESQGD